MTVLQEDLTLLQYYREDLTLLQYYSEALALLQSCSEDCVWHCVNNAVSCYSNAGDTVTVLQ